MRRSRSVWPRKKLYATHLRPSSRHCLPQVARITDDVETIQVSADFNIDIAPDGTDYGIELLNANQQVRAEDQGKSVVINEASGERQEVLLAQ